MKKAYIKNSSEIVMAERLERLTIIKHLRARGLKKEAIDASRSSKAAWAVAFTRKRFFENGSKAYVVKGYKKVDGKRVLVEKTIGDKAYKSLTANKKAKAGIIIRDGSGTTLEQSRIYEMFLAARAAFLGGYSNPRSGKHFDKGWKAASSAASNELMRGLKEPMFEDFAKAEAFSDKVRKIIAEEIGNVQDVNYQEEAQAEFSFAEKIEVAKSLKDFDVQRLGDEDNRRSRLAGLLWIARKRVINHWKSSDSRQWKASWAKDSKTLRGFIASALAGELYAGSHNSHRRATLRRIAQIVEDQSIADEAQSAMEKAIFNALFML
jgi:hypothetical protein